MGKRKETRRKKILQLKTNQETYQCIWSRQPVQQTTQQMQTQDTTRNNPLSGLLSHYMDCDDDEESGDESEKTGDINEASNPHSIDVEVADFLKEIDAITDDVSEQKDASKIEEEKVSHENQWQECVDETTGYTYFWNVVTNEVTWERPNINTEFMPSTHQSPTPPKKFVENDCKPVKQSPEISDDGKIVPISFYGPGSSNGDSSNEDSGSSTPEKNKMGPHLPVDDFELSTDKVFQSPDHSHKSNSSTEEQTEEPDSTTRAKIQSKESSYSNLFCGPVNATVFAPPLDEESDTEENLPAQPPVYVFPTTNKNQKKQGLGFGRLDENEMKVVSKNGKNDKISFVKAETLDLNTINKIAVSEWTNGKQEVVEKVVEEEVEIDVDKELDLALERNDDVTQLATGIFAQLDRLGVSSSSVTNLQTLYVEMQTRLEDFRQGALKRSYLLSKLRQTDTCIQEIHQSHTCKDRIETEVSQPDTTGNNQQTPSVVTSSTALFSVAGLSLEVPPLPPPPPQPESPPPPPPDSTEYESSAVAAMELDDSAESAQLNQPDMQMELNSFYSDIGLLSEADAPSLPVITTSPIASTSGTSVAIAGPSVSSSETQCNAPVIKKKKKLKKTRMATGLVLKKKNMPYLVEKWQKIKREEAKNESSSDEEKSGVSTTRRHSDD